MLLSLMLLVGCGEKEDDTHKSSRLPDDRMRLEPRKGGRGGQRAPGKRDERREHEGLGKGDDLRMG